MKPWNAKKQWRPDMPAETLLRFGESLGLSGLAFNDQGVCALEIERLGQLRFERLGEMIYLCLARAFPDHDQDMAERALKTLARISPPVGVRPGLFGENTLILAVRLAPGEFTLTNIDSRLELLGEIMEEIAGISSGL
jgi:type III secretion system chaperone SycN